MTAAIRQDGSTAGTAAEVAALMSEAPEWAFGRDPSPALAYCATTAAEHDAHGRREQARFWADTAVILVEIADNPNVTIGTVLASFLAP